MSTKKPPQARPTRLKSTQQQSPADEEAALRQMALRFGGSNAQASKRSNGKSPGTLEAFVSATGPDDPRIIERKGRIRSDGSRVGVGVARKMTIYLPLEDAEELEIARVRRRMDFGQLVSEALATQRAIIGRKQAVAELANGASAKAATAASSKRPAAKKKSAAKKPARKRRAA